MPTPRTEFGVATVNNKIYAIGGYSGSVLRTVEEYDPSTDTWTLMADMPTPRRQLIVVAANNKIYAIGGVHFTSDPNSLVYSYSTEEYDPFTNTWASKAPMPTGGGTVNSVLGNRFIGGAVANGKIYVAAHSNNGLVPLTHTLEYDPPSNIWTSKTQPPFSYTRYAVASHNNTVYALSDLGELAEYDPIKDSWTIRLPASTGRFRTGFTSAGGKLYSIGGGQGSSPSTTVEEYDPETHNWAQRASIAAPRVSPALGEAVGKLYVIGGSANTSENLPVPLTTVEEGSLPPPGSVLQVPTGNAVTAGSGQVTFGWNPVVGATSYNLYMASDSNLDRSNYAGLPDGAKLVGVSSPHTVTGLTNGKTYYFFVTAADATRESEDSFGISATPARPPGLLWRTRAAMPTPRLEAGAAVVNGKVYVIGGFSGSALTTTEEYDPVTDTWTTKASMPTARRSPVVAAVNNKIYAIGGMSYINANQVTYSYATEEYDSTTNTWTTKGAMPPGNTVNPILGNRFIAGTAINGKIYVAVFNNSGTPPISSTFEYDPVTDTWNTNKAPVPFGNNQYAVATLGGKFYALTVSSFAEYDPVADVWIIRPSSPKSLSQMRLVALPSRNKLYAIGGFTTSDIHDTVQEYDPNANIWTTQTSVPIPRHSTATTEVGGKVYTFGGSLFPHFFTFLSPLPLADVEEGQ
jgi:N-acetylneuraminic acid mutarotase